MPETDAREPGDAGDVAAAGAHENDGAGAEKLAWQVAEVLEVIRETPRAVTLLLDVPGWRRDLHRPGQHVAVRLTGEDGYQAQRLYSIASPPESPRLALTVERFEEGEVSPYLAGELRPGDRFELRGPIGGHFVWTVAVGGPLLLIGGGSGVVPLMAMLRHRAAAALAPAPSPAAAAAAKAAAKADGAAHRMRAPAAALLLYSSRVEEDIIYRAELDGLAARRDGLTVVYTLTRQQPPGWSGGTRRLDRAMIAEAAGSTFAPAAHPHVYICGSNSLVESAARHLIELGHDPRGIKTERFGPTA
jgi:ferredoxin-NADP reductase